MILPIDDFSLIEENKAIPIGSECCTYCIQVKPAGAIYLLPIDEPLTLNGETYRNFACIVCSECKDIIDPDQLRRSLYRLFMEFDIVIE